MPPASASGKNDMKTSTDRILTTHVGSLPRPQPLLDLLIKREKLQAFNV